MSCLPQCKYPGCTKFLGTALGIKRHFVNLHQNQGADASPSPEVERQQISQLSIGTHYEKVNALSVVKEVGVTPRGCGTPDRFGIRYCGKVLGYRIVSTLQYAVDGRSLLFIGWPQTHRDVWHAFAPPP
jgi:hypothetical protein